MTVAARTYRPDYTVSFSVPGTDIARTITLESCSVWGDERTITEYDLPERSEIGRAIQEATISYTETHGSVQITSVKRSTVTGSWDEVTNAYRVKPGQTVKITRITHGGLHRAEASYGIQVCWVKVARWEPVGNGQCRLIDVYGEDWGAYAKDAVFVTR
jgi:hypothetical protein